jgi:hypothetical protein
LEKETNQLNSTAILAQNLVNSKKNFETPWHSGVLTIPPFAEIAPFLFHVFLSPTLFLVHLPKVDRGNIWRHLTDIPIIQFIDFQLKIPGMLTMRSGDVDHPLSVGAPAL